MNRDELHILIHQIIHLYLLRSRQLMSHPELHPGQMPLLVALHRQDGQSQNELAAHLLVKPPTIAVSIKRMERHGLLERRRDTLDQRIMRVYLTEKSRALFDRLLPVIEQMDQELFQGFSMEETVLLLRFLNQIKTNLSHDLPATLPHTFCPHMNSCKKRKENHV